jgi:hypothetical protein
MAGIRGDEMTWTFLLEIFEKRNMDPQNQIKRGMQHVEEARVKGSIKQRGN